MLLTGVGEKGRSDVGWRSGRNPCNRCKEELSNEPLNLQHEALQSLSALALPGLTVSSQKPLVTTENSGASLKPAGVVNLGKLLLHFFFFFFPWILSLYGSKQNLECVFGFMSPPSVNSVILVSHFFGWKYCFTPETGWGGFLHVCSLHRRGIFV